MPVRHSLSEGTRLKTLAGTVLPVMSSSTAKGIFELPTVFRMASSDRSAARAGRALPVDADGHHLAGAGADQYDLIQVGGLQR